MNLAELLATDPRTTPQVLEHLATSASSPQDIGLLLANPALPDHLCQQRWPTGTYPLRERFSLENALTHPLLTPATAARVVAAADTTTLIVSVRHAPDTHPKALTELANRALPTPANPNPVGATSVAADLISHPNLPRPVLRRALRVLLTRGGGAGTSDRAITWRATNDPRTTITTARYASSDRFADLHRYAAAAKEGQDPRALMRADLTRSAGNDRVAEHRWVDNITDTGDLELARTAWQRHPTVHIARAIATHPYLRRTDLAVQAVTHPHDGDKPLPDLFDHAPTQHLPALLERAGDVFDLFTVLERPDTPAEALEVLTDRLHLSPDEAYWVAAAALLVTHPNCPPRAREHIRRMWPQQDPATYPDDGRDTIIDLALSHLPHDEAGAGADAPLSVFKHPLLGAHLSRWSRAALARYPQMFTNPALVRVAGSMWPQFHGTLGELIATAETVTT